MLERADNGLDLKSKSTEQEYKLRIDLMHLGTLTFVWYKRDFLFIFMEKKSVFLNVDFFKVYI